MCQEPAPRAARSRLVCGTAQRKCIARIATARPRVQHLHQRFFDDSGIEISCSSMAIASWYMASSSSSRSNSSSGLISGGSSSGASSSPRGRLPAAPPVRKSLFPSSAACAAHRRGFRGSAERQRTEARAHTHTACGCSAACVSLPRVHPRANGRRARAGAAIPMGWRASLRNRCAVFPPCTPAYAHARHQHAPRPPRPAAARHRRARRTPAVGQRGRCAGRAGAAGGEGAACRKRGGGAARPWRAPGGPCCGRRDSSRRPARREHRAPRVARPPRAPARPPARRTRRGATAPHPTSRAPAVAPAVPPTRLCASPVFLLLLLSLPVAEVWRGAVLPVSRVRGCSWEPNQSKVDKDSACSGDKGQGGVARAGRRGWR